MHPLFPRLVVVGLLLAAVGAHAQERTPTRPPSSRAQAKGPLPDPVLLDGSKEAAEKRPEHGMLGEFELPGSEDSKSDKVGGGDQPGGGGEKDPSAQSQGAGSASTPGAGGNEKEANQQEQGQGQGTESTGAKGGAGAKAEGIQVAGLSDPDGGNAAAQSQAAPSKPGEVKIGDAGMQIKMLPPGTASAVVGVEAQPKGKDTPQSYDAKTPGGGKQNPGRGNQGIEKGRVMPAGL